MQEAEIAAGEAFFADDGVANRPYVLLSGSCSPVRNVVLIDICVAVV